MNKQYTEAQKQQIIKEATQVAHLDPFVKEGYRTCEIRTWQIAHRGNNYLG